MNSNNTNGRKKYMTNACKACKKRYRRCGGNTPCQACLESNLRYERHEPHLRRGRGPGTLNGQRINSNNNNNN